MQMSRLEGQRPEAAPGRRQFGMRIWLVGFALALVIPSLGLGVVVAWQAVGAYRQTFETRMQDTARALALAVDRNIDSYKGAMAALSGSAALDGTAPDLATFEIEARRSSAALGTTVILLDATSMRQLVNTALPSGQQPDRASVADFRLAAETRQPIVSNLVTGAVAGRSVVGVAVPVERGGRVPFVLAARLEPSMIAGLLEAQNLERGAFAVAVDGSGIVVARSREHESFVGQPAPSWFMNGVVRGREGFLTGAALEGREVVVAYAPLASAAGWTVAVAEPLAAYTESWQRPLLALALGGALILGAGALLALGFARHLVRPLAALAEDARTFAEADTEERIPSPSALPSNVREFEDLRIGFNHAGAALRARAAAAREAEKRQTVLVREVDHRAKNALAIVLSLVRLAPRDLPPRQFAMSVEGRIAAMARAHSLLAESGWNGAELRAVAEIELAPYGGRVHLAGPQVPLAADAVQPISMLLHELATNAAKHGAFSAAGGRVNLAWELEAGNDTLQILWTETGGPRVDGSRSSEGFGTSMIKSLAQQLGGRPKTIWAAEGLRFSLDIPLREATGRNMQELVGREDLGGGGDGQLKALPLRPQIAATLTQRRVLVVEDEVLVSLDLEMMLGELGYQVVGPAHDLQEGLRLAASEEELHAAILDVNLGGHDRSFPVADILETRGVPFMFATGYATVDPISDRGSVAMLQKPYSQQAVAEAMAALLTRAGGAPTGAGNAAEAH